jgi:hypothetical protein
VIPHSAKLFIKLRITPGYYTDKVIFMFVYESFGIKSQYIKYTIVYLIQLNQYDNFKARPLFFMVKSPGKEFSV